MTIPDVRLVVGVAGTVGMSGNVSVRVPEALPRVLGTHLKCSESREGWQNSLLVHSAGGEKEHFRVENRPKSTPLVAKAKDGESARMNGNLALNGHDQMSGLGHEQTLSI
jgi:hypothetical protein